jgi:hypothetical protein
MLAIDPVPGAPNPELLASWFPATTDTVEGMTNTLIYDKPGPVINPEVRPACLLVPACPRVRPPARLPDLLQSYKTFCPMDGPIQPVS